MKSAGVPVAYLDPSQGRIAWFCGFMLGKDTQNYYHAHEYVESYLNKAACAQMTNAYAYGTANSKVTSADITDKALAESLHIDNLGALTGPTVHLQSYNPDRAKLLAAWQQVKAS
jgi:spermidine/putrescine-binding protein